MNVPQRFDNVEFQPQYAQQPQQQQQQGYFAPVTAAVNPTINNAGMIQPQTVPFYPSQQQQLQQPQQELRTNQYTSSNFNLIDM